MLRFRSVCFANFSSISPSPLIVRLLCTLEHLSQREILIVAPIGHGQCRRLPLRYLHPIVVTRGCHHQLVDEPVPADLCVFRDTRRHCPMILYATVGGCIAGLTIELDDGVLLLESRLLLEVHGV